MLAVAIFESVVKVVLSEQLKMWQILSNKIKLARFSNLSREETKEKLNLVKFQLNEKWDTTVYTFGRVQNPVILEC